MLQELKSNNANLKKATNNAIATLHVQLGPLVKALILSQCDDSSRDQIEKILTLHPYDPSSASAEWPKVSIARGGKSGENKSRDDDSNSDDNEGLAFEIPRMDLFCQISGECTKNMVHALSLLLCYVGIGLTF